MSAENSEHDVAVTSPTWNSKWCHCWQIKGCGLIPCCLPNTICFMPCMWASATSQIKGLEEWRFYNSCCIATTCCPCCTFYASFKKLSNHYGIKQPSEKELCAKFCFALGNYFQMLDHILVKEELHMEGPFGRVVPDSPKAIEMER